MTRIIDAAVISELAKDSFTMVSLVSIHFPSVVRITDAGRDIVSGSTYNSSGHFLNIGDISEDAKLRVGTIRLALSAVDQTYVSLFLNNDWMDVRIIYSKALLDANSAVIGSPLVFFDGNISKFSIKDSGSKSSILIEAASHWANFEVISGRMTNPTSQKALFPTDDGMMYAANVIRDIEWGK